MTLARQSALWSCLAAWSPYGHRDIDDECIGIQRKNGIGGLLTIFRSAHNLELLTERLASYCDHLLMMLSVLHSFDHRLESHGTGATASMYTSFSPGRVP